MCCNNKTWVRCLYPANSVVARACSACYESVRVLLMRMLSQSHCAVGGIVAHILLLLVRSGARSMTLEQHAGRR